MQFNHILTKILTFIEFGFCFLHCSWISFSVENPLFLHILDHQRTTVWQFRKGKWKGIMQPSNPIQLSYCWNVSMERGYGNVKKCDFCIWELKVCQTLLSKYLFRRQKWKFILQRSLREAECHKVKYIQEKIR